MGLRTWLGLKPAAKPDRVVYRKGTPKHPSKEDREKSVHDLRRLFIALQPMISPDLFIEAGAKDGSLSIEIRQHLPEARVVAFEANPIVHRLFAREKDFASRAIEYENLALAQAPGTATFHILKSLNGKSVGRRTGRSSLLTRNDRSTSEDVEIQVTSLDHYFGDSSLRSCSLWIDVEGANREVLLGGRKTLARATSVLIEVEEKPQWEDQWLAGDVIDFLESLGLTPVSRDIQSGSQYNVLLLDAASLKDERIAAAVTSTS